MNPYTWINYLADGLWYTSLVVGFVLFAYYTFKYYSSNDELTDSKNYGKRALDGIGIMVAGTMISAIITVYDILRFF